MHAYEGSLCPSSSSHRPRSGEERAKKGRTIILLDFFFGNEVTYFDEVRTTIYKQLRLLENQYVLSIKARYNT
jgi:hypothetical protein